MSERVTSGPLFSGIINSETVILQIIQTSVVSGLTEGSMVSASLREDSRPLLYDAIIFAKRTGLGCINFYFNTKDDKSLLIDSCFVLIAPYDNENNFLIQIFVEDEFKSTQLVRGFIEFVGLHQKRRAEMRLVQPAEDDFLNLTRVNNELIQMRRDLIRKNAELATISEEKEKMTSMMVHDLRGPLSSISLISKMMLDEKKGSAIDKEKYIKLIFESSEHLLSHIEELLSYRQLTSGFFQLRLSELDFTPFLLKELESYEPLASARNLSIDLVAGEELPAVSGDLAKLRLVIQNLIVNAIKFSHFGTTITIQATAVNKSLQISIHNVGPQIPEEEIPRLFQPFVQARGIEPAENVKSNGLGLAIVKAIVEKHGGEVWIKRGVKNGAEFGFTLPVTSRK